LALHGTAQRCSTLAISRRVLRSTQSPFRLHDGFGQCCPRLLIGCSRQPHPKPL
jgi:hypothetical protein